jgi:four helix bundle protein
MWDKPATAQGFYDSFHRGVVAKSFRELKVWQLAIDLSLAVYELTADFPKHELYGMTSQMRRAAVSIASNIAEGSARGTKKDFRQFVLIAKGSLCELQTQLLIARKLKDSGPERFALAESQAQDIAQMLSGLSKYLSSATSPKHVR